MAFYKLPGDRRETKAVLESRTVLCSIIGMVASIAGLFGWTMTCEDQGKWTDLLLALFTLFSSFGSFIFRIFATKMIG